MLNRPQCCCKHPTGAAFRKSNFLRLFTLVFVYLKVVVQYACFALRLYFSLLTRLLMISRSLFRCEPSNQAAAFLNRPATPFLYDLSFFITPVIETSFLQQMNAERERLPTLTEPHLNR